MTITVAIAHIPTRMDELHRAMESVNAQTHPPEFIVVEPDHARTGGAATKNRALARVKTDWVAFLDDDDEFMPQHLSLLATEALMSDADVVYSWPLMCGGNDPRPDMFGKPFDADELRRGSYLHTTILVRTDLAQRVGGFQCLPGSDYDDHGFHLALLDAGALFVHVPERTWIWHIGGNTSGRPDRW